MRLYTQMHAAFLCMGMSRPSLRVHSESYLRMDLLIRSYVPSGAGQRPQKLIRLKDDPQAMELKVPGGQGSNRMEMVWLGQAHKTEEYNLDVKS